MDLLTFITDLGRRKQLADALGKSPDYLWQLGTGWNGRKPSPDLAISIERATQDIGPEPVACEGLREDLVWTRSDDGAVVGWGKKVAAPPLQASAA